MRLKVKRFAMIRYGTELKAWVILNPGQIWGVYHIPSKQSPFYGIERKNVILEVEEEYINGGMFEEVME